MEITATDWLEMEFIKLEKTIGVHGAMYELIEKAKEREKQQTINFAENYELYESDKYPRKTFEQYYNEIFKNK